MLDDRERIARLEQSQESMAGLLSEVRDDIRQLRQDWTRARGLVAGVVLTVSVVWAAILGVWTIVRHKVTG